MKSIRILLADDHKLLRMGLTALLRYESGLTIVGEASDGEEAVRETARLKPDVVIMDLAMPGVDGVCATQRIHAAQPGVKILILTTFGTSADVAHAIAAGASGAIMKDASNDELIAAIRTVAAGGTAFSSEIRRSVVADPPPSLTDRQREILLAITRGLTNKNIAALLGIGPDRVKQHIAALLAKIGAANRTEAVAIALRKQLLKA